MTADQMRYKLKQADEYRERARRWDAMAEWIRLSREAGVLLIDVPEHSGLGGRHKRRELSLDGDESIALQEFLRERATRSSKIADHIDAEVAGA